MNQPGDILPLIRSYAGEEYNFVSKEWNDILQKKNKDILNTIRMRYDGRTLQESLEDAIDAGDIDIVQDIAINYIGYLPINWNHLYDMTRNKHIRKILFSKLLYLPESDKVWGLLGMDRDIPIDLFKKDIDEKLRYVRLVRGIKTGYRLTRPKSEDILLLAKVAMQDGRYDMVDYLFEQYQSAFTFDNTDPSVYKYLYLEDKVPRSPDMDEIIYDQVLGMQVDFPSIGDIFRYDSVNVLNSHIKKRGDDFLKKHTHRWKYLHGNCLTYLLQKYPNLVINELSKVNPIYNICPELRGYTPNKDNLIEYLRILMNAGCVDILYKYRDQLKGTSFHQDRYVLNLLSYIHGSELVKPSQYKRTKSDFSATFQTSSTLKMSETKISNRRPMTSIYQ